MDPSLRLSHGLFSSAPSNLVPVQGSDHLKEEKEERNHDNGADGKGPCCRPPGWRLVSSSCENDAIEQNAARPEVEDGEHSAFSNGLPECHRIGPAGAR